MKYLHLKKTIFAVAFLIINVAMLFWLIPLGERNVALQPAITRFSQLYMLLMLGGSMLYSVLKCLRQREGKPFTLKEKVVGSIGVIWVVGGLALIMTAGVGKIVFIPMFLWFVSLAVFFGWCVLR